MLAAPLRLSWILLCALLAACGGGGGGGGGGSGGSEPPAVVANLYLPTDASIRLGFNNLNPPAQFESPIRYRAYTYQALRYWTGGKEFFVTTADTIALAGIFSPFIDAVGLGTYSARSLFDTPLVIFRNSGNTQLQDVAGQGRVTITPTYGERPLDYRGIVRYLGQETVANGLGRFTAERVRVELTLSTTIEGLLFELPVVVEYWFVPRLGIVRRSEFGQVFNLTSASGPDTDGDGVFDGIDAFPGDAGETADFDADGTGDNADGDDDNDGTADAADAFPRNPAESTDTDGDGSGNNADGDDDNDGVIDPLDRFPLNPAESSDFDDDNIGDNADGDDDNDGVADATDRFPRDPLESADLDNDGIGDNADIDIDGDGYPNFADAYPRNAQRFQLLAASPLSREISGVFGSSQQVATTVAVTGANIAWSAQSSASWLSVSPSQGTGAATLTLTASPALAAPGSNTATVTITDLGDPRSIPVALTLNASLPVLTASQAPLVVDGKFGWSDPSEALNLVLNTGTHSYPVTADVAFSPASTASVQLSSTQVNASGVQLTATVDPVALSGGVHTGTVTANANVLGQTISLVIPLEVRASERVLYPSDDGIAFARIGGRDRLTQTIRVLDSYGLSGTDWTATTSAPWLAVTASGGSGDTLTVTADPSGLAESVLHEATIAIATDDPAVEATPGVRVALWIEPSGPTASHVQPGSYTAIVGDSLRPYFYAHGGSNSIDVYNIHTRGLVRSITGLGSSIGEMAVSSDGRWLFVVDPVGGGVTRIDLDDPDAPHVTWPVAEGLVPGGAPTALAYVRAGGRGTLLLNDLRMVNLQTGTPFPVGHVPLPITGAYLAVLGVSDAPDVICGTTRNQSPFTAACTTVAYGTVGGADVRLVGTTTFTGFSMPSGTTTGANAIAFNASRSRVFIGLAPTTLPVVRFNDQNGQYLGPLLAVPGVVSSLAMDADEVLYAWVRENGDPTLRVFEPDGSLRLALPVGVSSEAGVYRQLVVSADGFATVANVALFASAETGPGFELRYFRPY